LVFSGGVQRAACASFSRSLEAQSPNVERRTLNAERFLLARQFVLPMFIPALWMQI
jgi:hypothetical protein